MNFTLEHVLDSNCTYLHLGVFLCRNTVARIINGQYMISAIYINVIPQLRQNTSL